MEVWNSAGVVGSGITFTANPSNGSPVFVKLCVVARCLAIAIANTAPSSVSSRRALHRAASRDRRFIGTLVRERQVRFGKC